MASTRARSASWRSFAAFLSPVFPLFLSLLLPPLLGLPPGSIRPEDPSVGVLALDDRQESLAVHSFYASTFKKLHVTAVKPVTGNLVYGTGSVEAVIAALTTKKGLVPPVTNLESPDPECPLPFVREKAKSCPVNVAVLNTFGFGGQNASLVFKKC
jgi:hypothetical protein